MLSTFIILTILVLLWLYGLTMAAMLRWLPQLLEQWLFGKPKDNPVKRSALTIIIEVEDLNR